MHPCWHGRSTRSIFDHRETVMGLCRLPRTVCERVGERWRDGAGSLLTLGYRVTKMLAHMLAWAVDAVDFRPSVMGLCRLPCTGCERVRERWRDGVVSLLILGYRVIPMHAPMLAWAVDAADFRPSRNGDGTVPAAAHSLWASRKAFARRRGQFADLGLSGHTDACTHVGTGGRRGRFSIIEKR
jgi:hypothetical protein